MVWLFDESTASENSQSYGRFAEDDCQWEQWPYIDKSYRWLRNPRRFLNKGPNLRQFYQVYSVCVCTGTEGDVFHRIVGEHIDFQYVTFSLHNIKMSNSLDIEEFFNPEIMWQSQDPGKTEITRRIAEHKHHQAKLVIQDIPAQRWLYRRGR